MTRVGSSSTFPTWPAGDANLYFRLRSRDGGLAPSVERDGSNTHLRPRLEVGLVDVPVKGKAVLGVAALSREVPIVIVLDAVHSR